MLTNPKHLWWGEVHRSQMLPDPKCCSSAHPLFQAASLGIPTPPLFCNPPSWCFCSPQDQRAPQAGQASWAPPRLRQLLHHDEQRAGVQQLHRLWGWWQHQQVQYRAPGISFSFFSSLLWFLKYFPFISFVIWALVIHQWHHYVQSLLSFYSSDIPVCNHSSVFTPVPSLCAVTPQFLLHWHHCVQSLLTFYSRLSKPLFQLKVKLSSSPFPTRVATFQDQSTA